MSDKFILDENGEPQPCPDLETWARWFESSNSQRKVARETIGDSEVSTVFLGLNHAFGDDENEPVLWETMVFGGKHDHDCERCGGPRVNAVKMHNLMLQKLANEL